MILPLSTALPFSHSNEGEIYGESFISMKDVHSLLKNESKSASLSRDVLKRHLGAGCLGCLPFKVKEMGMLSQIMME